MLWKPSGRTTGWDVLGPRPAGLASNAPPCRGAAGRDLRYPRRRHRPSVSASREIAQSRCAFHTGVMAGIGCTTAFCRWKAKMSKPRQLRDHQELLPVAGSGDPASMLALTIGTIDWTGKALRSRLELGGRAEISASSAPITMSVPNPSISPSEEIYWGIARRFRTHRAHFLGLLTRRETTIVLMPDRPSVKPTGHSRVIYGGARVTMPALCTRNSARKQAFKEHVLKELAAGHVKIEPTWISAEATASKSFLQVRVTPATPPQTKNFKDRPHATTRRRRASSQAREGKPEAR